MKIWSKHREPLFVFLFVLTLGLFLFGNFLGAGYVLDDHSVIENRTELRSFFAIYKSFLMPWHQNQPEQGNYRPLTLLSYALTLSWSESTAIMRFINILIHAANAVLVFCLVRLFFPKNFAYFVAVGFALLPINAGTVLSLVGRSDILGTFFALLSLILFLKEKYGWSVLSFLFALLSKEFYIFLLPVTIFFLLFFKKQKSGEILKMSLYYSLALVPYFTLRYLSLGVQAFKSQSSVDPIIGPLAFVGFNERILTGFVYFYLYLRKTFIPMDLSPDYSFNQIPVPEILSPSLITGLVLFLGVVLIFFKNKNFKLKAPVILFLIPFGLISNTFFVTIGTFAERWWYFPSIGLLWFVSVFVWKILENKKRLITRCSLFSILIIGISYLFVSFEQAKIWTDERRLFTVAAERSPDSAWARANLAAVYFKEKKFDLAKEEVEGSLGISENYPAALNIYAKLIWREGGFDETESAFKRALKYDINKRNNRDLYRSLSTLKLETKNYSDAKNYINETINSKAFGDIKKTVYLDDLFSVYVDSLAQNKPNHLSDQENKIVEAFIAHIRGF